MLSTSSRRKLRYQKTLETFGESPKSLQWANYRAAAIRYRELVADIDISGQSILDAGCGMGDLLPYLYAKTLDFQYTGVDITPQFIEIAKKRYEGHNFKIANPFAGDIKQKFDIVISSGVMNTISSNWLEERKQMITELWKLTNKDLIFNMAGSLLPLANTPKIAYANAQDILNFCLTLSSKATLRNQYHQKDFTITLSR